MHRRSRGLMVGGHDDHFLIIDRVGADYVLGVRSHNGDVLSVYCRPNVQMSVPSNLKMSVSPAFWRAAGGGIDGGAKRERWGVTASRGLAGRRSWWSAGACGSAAAGA